ncbi:helix-turn-helix domain-containing protein [Streptomyces sp. NEAU-Y11]|uniref:helix-turn-helix domain-containing protein n=1 Tax=Streptomyces cucumeris TaxID=2962890 RepID=UPI0020C83BC8|nr:helix-turn-helix domain-containing protein [Streptomyces sp. NEAU-Y11]MCP9205559.1 helix-turn-helix domain-containing protein [Streptomyces sp. NEAU-Y11]
METDRREATPMNRDPQAWARLGRALKSAREHRGLSQAELATAADVSARSVQDAEGGKVPKARVPYTLARVAEALGWPAGAVDSVLDGGPIPGGWEDVPALAASDVETILSQAMVRATNNVTAAEIRAATKIAVDELRRRGVVPEAHESDDDSGSANF